MSEVELLEWTLCEEPRRYGAGEFVERPGWVQVRMPGATVPHKNLVLRSVLSDDEADARIAATLREYEELGVDFLWWVTPSSRPLDLAERLQRHGMSPREEIVGMVADPGRIEIEPTPHVSARAVRPEDWTVFVHLQLFLRGIPPGRWPALEPAMRHALESQPHRRRYLGWVGDQAAGTAELILYERVAHFGGATVLPAYRGRGVYRAMVAERMREARERELPLVTNHCVADTSAPICRKLGFRDACAMRIFSSGPRGSSSRS